MSHFLPHAPGWSSLVANNIFLASVFSLGQGTTRPYPYFKFRHAQVGPPTRYTLGGGKGPRRYPTGQRRTGGRGGSPQRSTVPPKGSPLYFDDLRAPFSLMRHPYHMVLYVLAKTRNSTALGGFATRKEDNVRQRRDGVERVGGGGESRPIQEGQGSIRAACAVGGVFGGGSQGSGA